MPTRLLAALVVVALILVACGGRNGNESKRKSAPTTATSAPTTTTPGATSPPKAGDEVTANGTELKPPSSPDTRQIDAGQACRTFLDTPGGQCDIVMMAGGNVLWTKDAVSSSQSGADEQVWRLRFRVHSKTLPDGGWDVALALPEGNDQLSFANVTVKAADVTGDGKPELLVGYRSAGTGQFEFYDVLTYEPGAGLKVAAHRDRLHKGSVALEGSNIVDYSADQGAPECCPTQARRTVIGCSGGVFRVTESADVPIDQQPADYFA